MNEYGFDHEYDGTDPHDHSEDRYVEQMAEVLREFFSDHRSEVFYSRELVVHFEKVVLDGKTFRPHHWVTNHAMWELVKEGFLTVSREEYDYGEAVFYFHKSYRYPRRRIGVKISIINKYSDPDVSMNYGEHADQLFEHALLRGGFEYLGEDINEWQGKKWEESNHDLDFAVRKDGVVYGAEVKNTLDYIEKEELDIKIRLCKFLGMKPLFILRNAPTTYIDQIVKSGGYSMIFEAQVYPHAYRQIVEEMKRETLLPVMVSNRIPDGIITRFVGWHERKLG